MSATGSLPPEFFYQGDSTLIVFDNPRRCPWCGHMHYIALNVNGRTVCFCCHDERKQPALKGGQS